MFAEIKKFHMRGIGIGLSPNSVRLLIDDFGLVRRIKVAGLIFIDNKHVLICTTHTYKV